MKNKLFKKAFAVSLSALMLGSAAAALPAVMPFSLSVSAVTSADSFSYEVNSDNTLTITNYVGSDTAVVIPSSINNQKVSKIGSQSFSYYPAITSVIIPDSVTEIGDYAFSGCTGLTSISIPNSVTAIGEQALGGCELLKTVVLPKNLKELPDWLFADCTGLSQVTIPSGVTKIGAAAFFRCTSLKNITIPNHTTQIGNSAFMLCENLSSVNLPQGVAMLDYQTFSGCKALTEITLPATVKSIGSRAFENCSDLTKVTIPQSVTFIDEDSFQNCQKLTLFVKQDSYAERYAKNNSLPYSASVGFSNTSTISAASVQLGNSVTVTCSAKNGDSPVTYAVYYRKAGTSKWSVVQGYKTNTSVKVTPKAAVHYEIRVAAKDASGMIVRKDMKLSVTKPLTNTSKLGADSIKLGEKVKVRCFAQGGTQPYQYAVYCKKASSAKWSKLRDYGSTNIIMYQPATATKYDVIVHIKDAAGKIADKTLSLTVTK